jgi:hypothetical protein
VTALTILAEGAPTGAGLAIVGVILLAIVLAFLTVVGLLVRWSLRRRGQS